MAIDVTVLRVFTDGDGQFGNPLGVVDASTVNPGDRQRIAAEPDDYSDDVEHYLWTWTDRENGVLRSRMFAAGLGVPEDEATGAAAVRITDYLSRDLTIVQGKGSVIATRWSADGWVRVAG